MLLCTAVRNQPQKPNRCFSWFLCELFSIVVFYAWYYCKIYNWLAPVPYCLLLNLEDLMLSCWIDDNTVGFIMNWHLCPLCNFLILDIERDLSSPFKLLQSLQWFTDWIIEAASAYTVAVENIQTLTFYTLECCWFNFKWINFCLSSPIHNNSLRPLPLSENSWLGANLLKIKHFSDFVLSLFIRLYIFTFVVCCFDANCTF